MKDLTKFILNRYRKMSGAKKVKIAARLSEAVRIFRKAGMAASGH